MSPDDKRHGTLAGYAAHRKDKEAACDDCRRAAATYQARRLHERNHGKQRLSDATGTTRRIQALMALGWTADLIGEKAGMSRQQVTNLTSGRTKSVRPATAAKVARAYKALSMKLGPSTLNRVAASRKGWPPPMAWDDIDRDTKPTGWAREKRGCGTRYGYHAHYHADEPACDRCKAAHAAYVRGERAA